jgi:hypothetical protein
MTPINQSDSSPAPGIIPGPIHVTGDAAPLTAVTAQRNEPHGRRNPVRTAGAKVMSALRGDKYMVDAYSTPTREDPAASANTDSRAHEG